MVKDLQDCTVATAYEGLYILLRRLAYPNRLEDISSIFGRSVVELSYILNAMLDMIYDYHSSKLTLLNHNWLSMDKLNIYTNAIFERGAPQKNVWGFIDGTVRPICRPSMHRNMVENKRMQCLKFQLVHQTA